MDTHPTPPQNTSLYHFDKDVAFAYVFPLTQKEIFVHMVGMESERRSREQGMWSEAASSPRICEFGEVLVGQKTNKELKHASKYNQM